MVTFKWKLMLFALLPLIYFFIELVFAMNALRQNANLTLSKALLEQCAPGLIFSSPALVVLSIEALV